MQTPFYKVSEFFILFVLFPISLVLDYNIFIKMTLGILGFLYIVYMLLRIEKLPFKLSKNINWKAFWKQTVLKLFVIVVVTIVYMMVVDADNLFIVIKNKPLLWFTILFVYSVFSVYPQELIYRTFYFKRYQNLIQNKNLLIFINAMVFSLAHLFFKNTLVVVFTFIGGILFAITFTKTQSTVLVSIEHAIYGCWLFTVGMGDMLGFPS